MPVRVKICGVTTPADARAAVERGADYVGVNFCADSPRRVSIGQAQAIVAALGDTPAVGVFLDAPAAAVAEIQRQVALALLQFHGEEPPEYCAGWSCPVIKAIRARDASQVARDVARYTAADHLLVDTWVPGRAGGTGRRLDLALLDDVDPAGLFVAGGLRPETVADVVRALRPFAVDVASGVESRPGEKDHDAIERFINLAKAA
jgi:phosphoribosylanthranilate isomerase